MSISTKDFATLVSDQVTAIQAKSTKFINFTIGSVLRSIVEANAAVGLWFQALIVQLLATTRASTSTGADLVSWFADYGFTMLPASAATGLVTFSRFTASSPALIPFGATLQTADGSQLFTVIVDTTNAAYTPAGYAVAAGITSVTVPVTANVAGSGGNVTIGQITSIAQSISYIDTVTNGAAFTNGADQESEDAARSRFILYIAALARATKAAIGLAITTVQAGLAYTLVENQQYNGTVDNGYFYVVVDDGTGAPGSAFLNSVANAIDAVRGFTIRFSVFAPVVESATVLMTATIAPGYDPTATKLLAKNAVLGYINSLPLGTALPFTRLAQVAYGASAGITNITAVTLNGGTADLAATPKQVIKSSSVTVS